MTNGIAISSTSTTKPNRRLRNHSGDEYGSPNFATTKPVLQIITKTAGIAAIHALSVGGTMEALPVDAVMGYG